MTELELRKHDYKKFWRHYFGTLYLNLFCALGLGCHDLQIYLEKQLEEHIASLPSWQHHYGLLEKQCIIEVLTELTGGAADECCSAG
jgi:hypothetical protein